MVAQGHQCKNHRFKLNKGTLKKCGENVKLRVACDGSGMFDHDSVTGECHCVTYGHCEEKTDDSPEYSVYRLFESPGNYDCI